MSETTVLLVVAAVALALVIGGVVGAIMVERCCRKRTEGSRPAYTQDLERFADAGEYWSQFDEEEEPRLRRSRGRPLGKRNGSDYLGG